MSEHQPKPYTLEQAASEAERIQAVAKDGRGYDDAEETTEWKEKLGFAKMAKEINELRNERNTELRIANQEKLPQKVADLSTALRATPEQRQDEIAGLLVARGAADLVVSSIDELPGVDRKKLADSLMEAKETGLLLRNIEKFNAVVDMGHIAKRAAANNEISVLADHIDKFESFDYITTRAFIDQEYDSEIAEHPEKFPEMDEQLMVIMRELYKDFPGDLQKLEQQYASLTSKS